MKAGTKGRGRRDLARALKLALNQELERVAVRIWNEHALLMASAEKFTLVHLVGAIWPRLGVIPRAEAIADKIWESESCGSCGGKFRPDIYAEIGKIR